LKELPENDDSPLHHTHIFFAHCFKTQAGWKELLQRFDAGKGTILDLEFLNDANGKLFFLFYLRVCERDETKLYLFIFFSPTGRRVAAFGYMAGFAGSAVAIDVWCHQKSDATEKYGALTPYPNEEALISYTKERLATAGKLNKNA
jgi:saccharopine dehydrogenase (NAD+, L-lysine-forming)